MENRRVWIVTGIVLTLAVLPYILAERAAGGQVVFGGFLLNPLDGNSYLAKMYEGWQGRWTFTLPYTAVPGEGTHIFLFYLLLGHIARWTNLSLLSVFHLARVLTAFVLLLQLNRFFSLVLPERRWASLAFTLATLGGGLGWLAYPLLGRFTPDLWVAEAFPFLSIYANPHFPLALALLIWCLQSYSYTFQPIQWTKSIGAGLFLGILLPFGVVIAGLLLGARSIWEWVDTRKFRWQPTVALLLGGAPMLLYQWWVVQTSPQLAAWNSQNVTLSPDIITLIFGFSPMIFAGLFGGCVALRRKGEGDRWLLLWAGLGMLMMYFPLSLQRRFMLGLFIPITGLAVIGVKAFAGASQRRIMWAGAGLLALSLPTMLLVVVSGLGAVANRDPVIFLSRGEQQALSWINTNTPPEALILAAPVTGAYIPAYTGRRVLYGHPFETVNADTQKALVENFYRSPQPDLREELRRIGVNFVFFGPREQKIGSPSPYQNLTVAWQGDGVTIYSTGLP